MVNPLRSNNLSPGALYGISFVEGAMVMAAELLAAKIIAPYYGSSLIVWSSVMGVTLGALALGYFLGARFSGKQESGNFLFYLLFTGAVLIVSAPLIAPGIMMFSDMLGVRLGSLASALIFLSPPLICMGMISPFIIHMLSESKGAGQAAGHIYAISTCGGIVATFLFGFYLLPEFGIKKSAWAAGAVSGIISLIYFIESKNYKATVLAFASIFLLMILSVQHKQKNYIKIIHQSEGLLGQLTVIDYDLRDDPENPHINRTLMLDGIEQTNTQLGYEPLSLWDYPHKISALGSIKPKGSKALLLGMGGGSIAYELVNLGFELDIVELDPRIRSIAGKYFNYDFRKSNLIIDDARHYIRQTDQKYDLVIFDVVRGEVQPSYIFTMESFRELKNIIHNESLVLINFQGSIHHPEYSAGSRSVYKTLQASGFYVSYNNDLSEENPSRDLIFMASLNKIDYRNSIENLRYYEWFPYRKFEYEELITDIPVDISNAHIFTDDKPLLEMLNSPIVLNWRKIIIRANTKKILEAGTPLY